MTDPDERRIRGFLRGLGVGPDAPPPSTPERPAARPAAREPDWLDRLYADEQDPTEAKAGEQHAWWSIRKETTTTAAHVDEQLVDETKQPTPVQQQVHVTIAPDPVALRARERRERRARSLFFHGTAAGAGWYLGLGPALQQLLADSGNAAPATGVGFALVTILPGLYLPYLTVIPPGAQRAVVWMCRIPPATALLAIALHTPNALI